MVLGVEEVGFHCIALSLGVLQAYIITDYQRVGRLSM